MIAVTYAPDAAVMRWVRTIPAVRCVAPAFRTWSDMPDRAVVPVTSVSLRRFEETAFRSIGFAGDVIPGFSSNVGKGNDDTYGVARVPTVPAIVLQFVSAGGNEFFEAAIADASSPPHAVATLGAAPRTLHGLGLGSTRAAVEAALGAGRAKVLCGYDVARYVRPLIPPPGGMGEMWFFYRHGAVAAIMRFETGD